MFRRVLLVLALAAIPACGAFLGLDEPEVPPVDASADDAAADAGDERVGTIDGSVEGSVALDKCKGKPPHTVGLVQHGVAGWHYLAKTNETAQSATPFKHGDVPANALPIAGSWTKGADVTTGWFEPSAIKMTLWSSNTNLSDAGTSFNVGLEEDLPVAGDWDGDGVTTVGVYRPSEAKFYLFVTQNPPDAGDTGFVFGDPKSPVRPFAGDWDCDGKDEVGTYNYASGEVRLKRDLTSSSESIDFKLPYVADAAPLSLYPIAGDWDGTGRVRVGLYDPFLRTFYLALENKDFPPILHGAGGFVFPTQSVPDALPIAGRWKL